MKEKTFDTSDAKKVLDKHKDALLKTPGCNGIAIGLKEVNHRKIPEVSIVIFVQKKGQCNASDLIPEKLDGIKTDVVEREFNFEEVATDPHARFDTLFSGIALTAQEDSVNYGTIGCFIRTNGLAAAPPRPAIPAGVYLLTNQHVVQVADPHNGGNGIIIQPNTTKPFPPPPANYNAGTYVYGIKDAQHDCAIVTLTAAYNRGWANQIPNAPWWPGRNTLAGTAAPQLNQNVYKYGATTLYTTANVRYVNYIDPTHTYVNAMYIENTNQGTWVDGGDSGSVVVTPWSNEVVGLNFRADTTKPALSGTGFYAGLAYDINAQMNNFGTVVTLA